MISGGDWVNLVKAQGKDGWRKDFEKFCRGVFCEYSLRLSVVNHFRENLHLRCLTGF